VRRHEGKLTVRTDETTTSLSARYRRARDGE
jgi:hypothetical protein